MSRRTTILVLSVDEAQLLEASLPPAVAQPDAEVLVIDNACVDRTRTVCEELGVRVVGLRERVLVERVEQHRCPARRLGQRRGVGAGDRDAPGHRLDHDET
ncbi:MAG TPA: glycosyltransferase, partial [Baekduia sp.]|nr:glycosyltransferase [Baekduia sp.]